MEQIAADQDEINGFLYGIGNNPARHTEEILVAFRFAGGIAVGLAKMDVGGVDKAHWAPVFFWLDQQLPERMVKGNRRLSKRTT